MNQPFNGDLTDLTNKNRTLTSKNAFKNKNMIQEASKIGILTIKKGNSCMKSRHGKLGVDHRSCGFYDYECTFKHRKIFMIQPSKPGNEVRKSVIQTSQIGIGQSRLFI